MTGEFGELTRGVFPTILDDTHASSITKPSMRPHRCRAGIFPINWSKSKW